MTKLVLGAAQFGQVYGIANQTGMPPRDEVHQILNLALLSGIDTIDTAMTYGESEKILGHIGVRKFKIITKLPLIPSHVRDVNHWIDQQIKQSLTRLRASSVDAILFHSSVDLLRIDGLQLMQSLKYFKSKNIVQKIGISIYDPSELSKIPFLDQFDIVQAPINLIDRRMEVSGWMKRLTQMGIEIHGRSVFLQGLLLMSRDRIPKKFDRWNFLWDKWHEKLAKTGSTAIRACLSYPLSLQAVTKVIVGVDNLCQLSALIPATQPDLDQADWAFMAHEDENLLHPFAWGRL
jgi:aryl-alcohol dehydrogenase-like predicted oxidoreductase